MLDQYGRKIDYLRISVTDRCNLRCRYCMPEPIDALGHGEILRYEEILRICRTASELGIRKFKVTGGEPLVRADCVSFIAALKRQSGTEQVTLTTNGLLLGKNLDALAAAGLDGINISLDSLNAERYTRISGHPEGAELLTLMAPVRIEADEEGNAAALWVQPQLIGEADKSGRPRPNKADLPEQRIPADIIVVAIGQGIEIQGFEQAGVPIKRGTFVAGLSGQVGDMGNLFAGGDCVTGPATAIRAIAAGKVAAANIDEDLGFRHEITVDVDIPAPRLNNRAPHGRINTTEREACERRCDFEDIECGLTEEGAYTEASRCLRCDHYGYGIFRGGRNVKW